MRRKERATVTLGGTAAEIEVEICVCNRCGARVLAQRAKQEAWVAVASDGRGGHQLDFCLPDHAAEYFRELALPEDTARPTLKAMRGAPVPSNGTTGAD